MHLVRKQVEMPGSQNRPQLFGVDVNPVDHVNEIIDGFRQTYWVFLDHRNELLEENGALAKFAVTKCARSFGRLRSMFIAARELSSGCAS